MTFWACLKVAAALLIPGGLVLAACVVITKIMVRRYKASKGALAVSASAYLLSSMCGGNLLKLNQERWEGHLPKRRTVLERLPLRVHLLHSLNATSPVGVVSHSLLMKHTLRLFLGLDSLYPRRLCGSSCATCLVCPPCSLPIFVVPGTYS